MVKKNSTQKDAKQFDATTNIIANLPANEQLSNKYIKGLNNAVIDATRAVAKKQRTIQTIEMPHNVLVTVDAETQLTDAVSQFLNTVIVLWNNTPGHDNTNNIGINLADYMDLKGISDTPDHRKNTARKIKQLAEKLYSISVRAELKNGKGKAYTYNARILQSDLVARDGSDYIFTLSDAFYKAMKTGGSPYVMPLPTELLRLDTSKDKYTWRIGYYLSKYQKFVVQRKREQTGDESITDMNTLLDRIGILKQNNRNVYQNVISRVIRSLDRLSNELHLFTYYTTDADERRITNFKELPLGEFKKYKLHTSWIDYPEEWIKLNGKQHNKDSAEKHPN